MRLVGSGAAGARSVLTAALVSFGVAGIAGLGLVAVSGYWWLLAVGAVCIAGAWFYTGGSKPYGYSGWGEAAVFLFFGLIGVLGTLYVQIGRLTVLGVLGAVAVGAFSAAVLVANNLRDVPTDREAGKRTLAVRLGEQRTRVLYFALVALPFVVSILAALATAWTLAGLLALLVVGRAARSVAQGVKGMALIPVLRDTSLAMLAWAALTTVALAVS
jgi:1,4-dihydroxy-2-naphthoate octaprenyltransferase